MTAWHHTLCLLFVCVQEAVELDAEQMKRTVEARARAEEAARRKADVSTTTVFALDVSCLLPMTRKCTQGNTRQPEVECQWHHWEAQLPSERHWLCFLSTGSLPNTSLVFDECVSARVQEEARAHRAELVVANDAAIRRKAERAAQELEAEHEVMRHMLQKAAMER